MNAWFAEIAIGIGASFATTLLVKATLTLAVALAATALARRSRAAARHVLLVAAFAVLLALPAASFVMPSRGVTLPAPPGAAFLLYAIEIHNARRITDPGDLTPIGGQFVGSYVEVDYVLIPEPSMLLAATLPVMLLPRRRSRGGARRQRTRKNMR